MLPWTCTATRACSSSTSVRQHAAIRTGFITRSRRCSPTEYRAPPGKPLPLAAYEAEMGMCAFVEPMAVGDTLMDAHDWMPRLEMPRLDAPIGHALRRRADWTCTAAKGRRPLDVPTIGCPRLNVHSGEGLATIQVRGGRAVNVHACPRTSTRPRVWCLHYCLAFRVKFAHKVDPAWASSVAHGPHSSCECGPAQTIYFQYVKHLLVNLVQLGHKERT